MTLLVSVASLAVIPVPSVRAGTPPSGFVDTQVTTGLLSPMSLVFLPDGSGRLVIVEQGGRISGWNGITRSTLHTMTEVVSGGERGLLGVEIDPDWPLRPYLYVYYTANVGFVQVARFDLMDPGGVLTLVPLSKLILIDDMPDSAGNHNGGTLRFAPDKTLYMSVGDDAIPCDAQDLTVLAGKILRIKVDASINPSIRSTLAPADNPFVGNPSDNAKLVWAYGLRNPFRFDIHPIAGHAFIGDVGQNSWEEVSLANASGLNLGWPYWEGDVRYQLSLCPVDSSLPPSRAPIYVYPNAGTASVIGASVYRSASFPNDDSFPVAYNDDFFFMDYYAGFLRVLRENPAGGTYSLVPGVSATNWGTGYQFVADMVLGPDGALYFATGGGALRKIGFVPQTPQRPTALIAALVNGRDDVELTWNVPTPETYVDHYEVYRSSLYDPARAGYSKVSSDPSLPPGSSTWTDIGAGTISGAYFYYVAAVGSSGEPNATLGQVAKFTRSVAAGPVLFSVPVLTTSNLVTDQFASLPWTIGRTFIASDAVDPWKHHDVSRAFNDFLSVDVQDGVWLNVSAAGDYRVAGSVPCTRTIGLRAGWNLVGFPSMATRTVADATVGLTGPIDVEAYDPIAPPYYLRRLSSSSLMSPTDALWIHAATDESWTITNDPSPGCI